MTLTLVSKRVYSFAFFLSAWELIVQSESDFYCNKWKGRIFLWRKMFLPLAKSEHSCVCVCVCVRVCVGAHARMCMCVCVQGNKTELVITTTQLSCKCNSSVVRRGRYTNGNLCCYRSPYITASTYPAVLMKLAVVAGLTLLKTKRRLLYLKTQFIPRSKHFSSRL